MGKNKPSILIYPATLDDNYVMSVEPYFSDEFKSLLDKSGRKAHITAKFKQHCKYLCEKKKNCTLYPQWFEQLKGNSGIYSTLITDKDLNLRIVFVFATIDGEPHALLVAPFLEKEKPTSKKQSYGEYSKKSKDILSDLEEVYYE